MYKPLRIFSKAHKVTTTETTALPIGELVTTTETVSVSVTLNHTEATPENELAQWRKVLEELGKSDPLSEQELIAREVVKGRIRELKRKLSTPTEGERD